MFEIRRNCCRPPNIHSNASLPNLWRGARKIIERRPIFFKSCRLFRLLAFPICSSHALALPRYGRKFGNFFLQFSDTTVEIGPRGVTPFSAGLCASIKPHIVFGIIVKNLELDRTKDNLGSPRKFGSNPSKIIDELVPWQGKGAQIQI